MERTVTEDRPGIRIRTEVKAQEPRPAGQAAAGVDISIGSFNLAYGDNQVLHDVSMEIEAGRVTAFIGPSGCGKSTFLRSLNRMNDTIAGARVEGEILLDGEDIYKSGMDVVQLRARVGMVFQKPNPFPKSIFER